MMSPQPHHDLASSELYLGPRRSISTGGYYGHRVPYATYCEQPTRQDPGPEYGSHTEVRLLTHEQTSEYSHGGNSRKRIQLACTRCRRRKIKCSGDPGDGTGCQACRSSSPEISQICTFVRVGSEEVPMQAEISFFHAPMATQSAAYLPHGAGLVYGSPHMRHSHPVLPSKPIFHTPGLNHYPNSYTGSTNLVQIGKNGQQDATATTLEHVQKLEQPRSWPTSAAMAIAMATTPGPNDASCGYELESYQGQYHHHHSSNEPASNMASSRTMSSLDMDTLHSSLPAEATQHRTLPAPYCQTQYYGLPVSIAGAHSQRLSSTCGVESPQQLDYLSYRTRRILPTPSTAVVRSSGIDSVHDDGLVNIHEPESAELHCYHSVADNNMTLNPRHSIIHETSTEKSLHLSSTPKQLWSEGFSGISSDTWPHHGFSKDVAHLPSSLAHVASHDQASESSHGIDLYSYSVDSGDRTPLGGGEQHLSPVRSSARVAVKDSTRGKRVAKSRRLSASS